MRQPGCVMLGRVGRGAGDLLAAVDPAHGLSDVRRGHARAPAVATARTMTRCMSSILYSLWPYPLAPCVASAAAWRSGAGSSVAPIRAASTWGTRHGFVPTPPRAT